MDTDKLAQRLGIHEGAAEILRDKAAEEAVKYEQLGLGRVNE